MDRRSVKKKNNNFGDGERGTLAEQLSHFRVEGVTRSQNRSTCEKLTVEVKMGCDKGLMGGGCVLVSVTALPPLPHNGLSRLVGRVEQAVSYHWAYLGWVWPGEYKRSSPAYSSVSLLAPWQKDHSGLPPGPRA